MSFRTIKFAIFVASLGYLVDVYDLILFSVVRIPSLRSLGVPEDHLISVGITLLNIQLIGMFLGGIVWGILGDKLGRTSVLFGSILIYSLANLSNAFVSSVLVYGILRFIAGFGLAGELGLGVTLVSELMDKRTRGYGAVIIATAGVFGSMAAGAIGNMFSWQTAYILGGVLGLTLLLLRLGIKDSPIFSSLKEKSVSRGQFLNLFTDLHLFKRYMKCLAVGAPVWIVIGVFITLSPEIAKTLLVRGPITAGSSLLFFSVGFGLGDLMCGYLSQKLKSRKKAGAIFILLSALSVLEFLHQTGVSVEAFYGSCVVLGLGVGFWTIFLIISSEQFGTNLRATVTTTLPNFVRVLILPLTLFLQAFHQRLGLSLILHIMALGALVLAFLALIKMEETFSKDLDFTEKKAS